jgi:chromosome segregation protein
VRETVISKPLYFGQKDLSAAGKEFGSDLVEKFVGEELKAVRLKIADRVTKLKTAVEALLAVHEDVEEKEAKEDELNNVKFKLEVFDKHGVKDKLDKQVAFGADVDFCQSVDQVAQDWESSIESAIADAKEEFDEIEKHSSQYNAEFFKRYHKKIDELKATLDQAKTLKGSISKTKKELSNLGQELSATRDSLKEEFAAVERELVKSLADQGVTSIQPDAYIKLTQQKTALETEIADLGKKTAKQQSKNTALLKAVSELNDAWHEEFKLVTAALAVINKAQPSLQVTSTFKGDKQAFRAKMEETFRGHSIRKESYQAIADGYIDFGEIYKDLDEAAANAKSKAEDFKELFFQNLFDLLSFQIPNSYEVTYHGKSLRSHSLGQRASAMMLFILSQKDHDLLLIDQPEDDLDSQTVYEEVVKLLRTVKLKQQFIFATHNANFPVLGDAETITSCKVEDEAMTVETGTIDSKSCQEKIVKIMEGGPEAFERRKTIYQIWKAG